MIFGNVQLDYWIAPGVLIDRRKVCEMKNKGIEAYCSCCGGEQLFVVKEINHWFHASLTILSLGIWLPVYLIVLLTRFMRPWRCSACGWHKPEFRKPYVEQMRNPVSDDE